MDDPDMGVTLSVTSLVMALAQDKPDEYKGSYVKAAQRLKKVVVDNDISPDYLYYRVPCPWIQVKLLRLLQYYPPSGMGDFTPFPYFSTESNMTEKRGQPRPRDHPRILATDYARGDGNAQKCPAE